MTALKENLERVEAAIALACRRAGRSRGEVELMAVSKTYPAATVAEAVELGLRLFGESRVQEFAAKAVELTQLRQPTLPAEEQRPFVSGHDFSRAANEATTGVLQPADKRELEGGGGFNPRIQPTESTRALAPDACLTGRALPVFTVCAASSVPIRVHLIGHLQSNKALRAVELFDAIDSLDSRRLAERLNEAATKLGKRLPVLIEVKLSPEETKAGLEPESAEAAQLLERLPDLQHLQTRGLMTIAPWGVAEDVTRACFRSLREWRDRWTAAHPKLGFDVLSMGMSGDFALAIEEGATRIRVGTALFGKRQPWTGPD
jgi:pyridoxal phosphate enzyme (YggS family)